VVKRKEKSMSTNMSYAAAGTGTVGARMIGNVPVLVDIHFAPPAPRAEVILAPPAGYVWSPGYWHWSGHKHDWVAGRNIRERQGYHWTADRWEQRGDLWHHEPGHWDLSLR
jgi:WXXGXW repeat (2 copies)